MKAKKSYGQHFLINENAAKGIVRSFMNNLTEKNVLEIGPGKGVLTKYLLEEDIHLQVVEADRDMVSYLQLHYPGLHDKILFHDFLKLDLSLLFEGQPFAIIGNFPYNISSQIIFKMIKYRTYVTGMVGMFQKEVADRIIAPHGNKTYGILSVLTQVFFEGRIIMKVNPGSFNPPPKVNSAVIELSRKKDFSLPCNESLFRAVVKNSFGQRRKMIRNTLKGMVENEEIFSDDFFSLRPEQLSLEQFITLTQIIEENQKQSTNG